MKAIKSALLSVILQDRELARKVLSAETGAVFTVNGVTFTVDKSLDHDGIARYTVLPAVGVK